MIEVPRDLPPLAHVGYIVDDIEAAADGFRRALGLEAFRAYDYVPLRAWATGRPLSPCRLRIGIGTLAGGGKVELIQPVQGATPQAAFLSMKGAGLHHLAFSCTGYDDWLDRFRSLGARIVFEAEAEDPVIGYRRSFYAEVGGMPGVVEITEPPRHRTREGV